MPCTGVARPNSKRQLTPPRHLAADALSCISGSQGQLTRAARAFALVFEAVGCSCQLSDPSASAATICLLSLSLPRTYVTTASFLEVRVKKCARDDDPSVWNEHDTRPRRFLVPM